MNGTVGNGTNFFIRDLGIVTNSINILLGLPINICALWLILSGAGGTIASEFFYLNLIVSVILSVLISDFYIVWLFIHGFILLTVVRFFYEVVFFFSVPLFQCCICVERYIAVVHPVVFLRYKHLWYKAACCCVVWLIGLACSSFRLWSTTVQSYVILGFCAACISVVCFCCLAVLRALKQPGPGEGQRDGGEGNSLKRRAFRIILISLVIMSVTIMCYIPYVVFDLQNLSIPGAGDIQYAVAMASGFVHPVLYMHKAGKLPCFKR